MRENFSNDTNKAKFLLEILKEKPKTCFNFKLKKVHKVYEVIDKAKNSKTEGSDNISMDVIKQCPQ